MMQSYIDINRIHRLSEGDKSVPMYQKIIKLGEEAGEVAAAFLEYDGAKNVSASSSTEEKVMGVLEECCDTINVSMDIINALTRDNYELEKAVVELFQKKLDKWERKQTLYTEPEKEKVIPTIPHGRKPGEMGGISGVSHDVEFLDFGTVEVNPTAQPTISIIDDDKIKTPQQVSMENLHKAAEESLKKIPTITAPVKKPHPFGTPKHNFPEKLYHSTGTELVPYKGELIYKPNYVLKPNQKAYGVENEWNVIVTFEDGKYTTEHPQEHFNNQMLIPENP
jgi:NTP pyrophosphatase (non-canonical NTP hydrolase)